MRAVVIHQVIENSVVDTCVADLRFDVFAVQ